MSIYLPLALPRTTPTPLEISTTLGSPSPLGGSDGPPSPWRPARVAASGPRRRAAQAEGGAPSWDRAAEEGGGAASRDQVPAVQAVGGAPSTVAAATEDGGGANAATQLRDARERFKAPIPVRSPTSSSSGGYGSNPTSSISGTYASGTSCSSSDGPHRDVAPSGKGKEVTVGCKRTPREVSYTGISSI
jgi:hypothetical protein